MFAFFDRFDLQMTADQARSASQPGRDAQGDVRALLRDPKIARQLRKIDPAKIRAELQEYGAWDEAQLANDEDNRERIVWIAAGNITEELAQRGRGLRGLSSSTVARPFEQHAHAVLAAIKVGDCSGAKIAAAQAIRSAKTPHQRAIIHALQPKVSRCTIKSAGRARRKQR